MMGQQGTRKKQSSFDWKNCGSTLCRHIVEVIEVNVITFGKPPPTP